MENNIIPWYRVRNEGEVNSPGLLIYPDRIEANIVKMIKIAGSAERLRPHVKTHKMPEIVKLQVKNGIKKFKCATISEAEMTAMSGAKDILLAMQPVGPNLSRFFELRKTYTKADISCIADNNQDIENISKLSAEHKLKTTVWLDINAGMNRTGIIPGPEAAGLFRKIATDRFLSAGGLHVYDGHIHEPDPEKRYRLCEEAFEPVAKMLADLEKAGFNNIRIVAGGTPSFPVHAKHGRAELSPGTTLLWDWGYGTSFTDMDFMHAAVLITRVVSKPAPGLLCLDLGHKAVASEMPHPRVKIMDLPDYEFTGHNEEHLVIRTSEAGKYRTGDALYCIPWHICPTVDRHDRAVVVRNNMAEGEWMIEARKRKISI
ncbi:MAG TPA: D-TA family PLP-dependent enzyme [Bacteroidales bacterium]|nr:D-TA family PLP-dependent enzyme [Bacteroidales bacterium]